MGKSLINWFSTPFIGLIALVGAVVAGAQDSGPRSHMVIADPAALNGARAESVYQSIRPTLSRHYFESGLAVTKTYQSWKRYNTVPYRSSQHGKIFVNNYANPIAHRYSRFESLGNLPESAIVIQDSFIVSESGAVLTGPLFLMEKKQPGFNAASNDWLFMTIKADGKIEGMTKGPGATNVEYCAACHIKAADLQDSLYFLPEEHRQKY